MSDYTHYIAPQRGQFILWLVNLLLRITVKWRLGSKIDIPKLRSLLGKPNEHAAKQALTARRQAVDCDGVNAEWLIPDPVGSDRVLLYLHGGAFVARSPELHAAMVANWCQTLNARALMVDYRLAPEHRWPCATDDCHAAYRWLLKQGFNAKDIVIAGDSAGGNLSLATLHRIKKAGEDLPSCAVLLSPFTDFTLSSKSMVGNAQRDPVFTPCFGLDIRNFYASPEDFLKPDVSPVFGDFSEFPPMLFQVGSTEMLLDDSVRAAGRAYEAGVQVQLEIWDKMPHVWQSIALLPQAQEASNHIVDFINQHCA